MLLILVIITWIHLMGMDRTVTKTNKQSDSQQITIHTNNNVTLKSV